MPEMLTIEEVLDRLKIGRSTLYRWVEEGKLKPYKAGGRRTFFKQEDVEKLFQPAVFGQEETPPLAPGSDPGEHRDQLA